jgi:hypothetical protein
MLSLLIAHIIITVLCLWSGSLFYKFFPAKNGGERPMIYLAISGLIILTILAQVIAVFFPINVYSRLAILGVLVLLSVYKRENTKILIAKIKIGPSLVLFFVLWAIILLINAGPIIMDDTESYHLQSIKWIQEYGSVPGLVNLHERLGFNSSWFSSVALFSFFPTTTGGYTLLNSVLSMWLCYWSISSVSQFKKAENFRSAIAISVVLIIGLAIWPLLRGNAASTNYDFITTCCVLILFVEIFRSKNIAPTIEWVIWPVYLFTVRIINFPLLLLSMIALIFFIKQKDLKKSLVLIACCLLLIAPFVIRNIIIAGYPFYPATSFDLAGVDWKPDPQMTQRLLEYIKYYNRVSTTYLEIGQTKALGSNWIPAWFKYLFLFDKILLVSGLTGIVLSIARLFTQKNKVEILLMAISVAWLTGWFLISPDPRFVYGVLLFGIFLLAYRVISLIKNLQLLNVTLSVLVIAMIMASSSYFISKLWKQPGYRNWLSPARLPQPPVKAFVTDGIRFHIPERINDNWNARCYGTGLPCLYKIDPRLKPRGKNIADGFRLEK